MFKLIKIINIKNNWIRIIGPPKPIRKFYETSSSWRRRSQAHLRHMDITPETLSWACPPLPVGCCLVGVWFRWIPKEERREKARRDVWLSRRSPACLYSFAASSKFSWKVRIMNEWMNDRMNEWMNEWMNARCRYFQWRRSSVWPSRYSSNTSLPSIWHHH